MASLWVAMSPFHVHYTCSPMSFWVVLFLDWGEEIIHFKKGKQKELPPKADAGRRVPSVFLFYFLALSLIYLNPSPTAWLLGDQFVGRGYSNISRMHVLTVLLGTGCWSQHKQLWCGNQRWVFESGCSWWSVLPAVKMSAVSFPIVFIYVPVV